MWLPFHFSLSCIGEGNGNPLQCSCLENPRDGGARWAAVCGVAQSQTRLTRLSSSSMPNLGLSRGSVVKNLPVNAGDAGNAGSILGRENPLEEKMAACSNILAQEIPWKKSLAGYSPCGCRESDTTKQVSTHEKTHAKLQFCARKWLSYIKNLKKS